MTLQEICKRWIDHKELNNRAPSTISGYRRLQRLYVDVSQIVETDVEDLDESDMMDLLRPLLVRGCTRQAQLLQTMVAASLKYARRRKWCRNNPMEGLDRVQHCGQLTAWLSLEEAQRLLTVSQANQDPYYVAWLLMLCCGLRRGEMLGLRWGDIDFSRQLLRVERQKIRVDGQVLVTKPKSRRSVREIPLNEHMITILRLLQADDGYILDCGDHQLADALDRAIRAADVPRVTLHGLRHTMAAIAASDGVTVKILQEIMGHAHYSTTADIYAHVNDRPRREAAYGLQNRLLGARLEIA